MHQQLLVHTGNIFVIVWVLLLVCLPMCNGRNVLTGFPRGIESTEKVLSFKIGFQDLEKVLNLAKMCIRC